MNHHTTFGFSPAWWQNRTKVSAKRRTGIRRVPGALLTTLLAVLIWP